MGSQEGVITCPESRKAVAVSPGSISRDRWGDSGLKYGPAVWRGVGLSSCEHPGVGARTCAYPR